MHHVSRIVVVGKADSGENPRWRRRVTVDGEASVACVGRGVAQELQQVVRKLLTPTVESVGVGSDVIDEDSGGGGEDGCRRPSGG
jgi:hypothetical protein